MCLAYKKQLKWDKAEAAWRDIISLSRCFLSIPMKNWQNIMNTKEGL